MRLRSIVGVCFLLALVGVIGSPEAVAAATCNTFDANNTPTSAFRGGEKIVVRGTGFAANSTVLVNLLQGNRTIELGRARAKDLGAFELTDTIVPDSVSDGDAAIRALDARGSATCALTLTAGDGDEGTLGGLFWIWGLGLALFGGVLAMLTYRRWKAERLREAVDSLAWRDQHDEQREPRPEPVAVGGRPPADVSRTQPADRSPSRTPDEKIASWTPDEQRPSWVTDGPRPSWVRPDDERGSGLGTTRDPRDEIVRTPMSQEHASVRAPAPVPRTDQTLSTPWEPARAVDHGDEPDDDDAFTPWEPGVARDVEPVADEPTFRPPVQRPIPERPVPARPAAADPWMLDDDDDLSAIGAPRPFDDRFALDDDVVNDEEPAPFRPSGVEGPAVVPAAPTRPVVSRPVPQRPIARDESDEADEWELPSPPSRQRDPAAPGAEPFRAEPFRAEPFPREPSAPETFPPGAPEPVTPPERMTPEPFVPGAPEPVAPITPEPDVFPAPAPHAPTAPGPALAPHAPGVRSERDFASALRDFLDAEDKELDRRSGLGERPAAMHPGGGLRPQDAGRIPQVPVRPTAPVPASPAAPGPSASAPPSPGVPGPVRPVAPRAPHAADDVLERRADTPEASDEPPRDAWRPRDVAEPRLQPGPVPSLPPQVPVRPGAERAVEAPARPGAERAVEAPARPGAEPLAFDPVQRPAVPRAPERRAPARPADPYETDPLPPDLADGGVSEPPVLPVGWDDGRLKPPPRPSDDERRDPQPRASDPQPRASDAIARLKREVRNWKR